MKPTTDPEDLGTWVPINSNPLQVNYLDKIIRSYRKKYWEKRNYKVLYFTNYTVPVIKYNVGNLKDGIYNYTYNNDIKRYKFLSKFKFLRRYFPEIRYIELPSSRQNRHMEKFS